jgi:hypothetical protein
MTTKQLEQRSKPNSQKLLCMKYTSHKMSFIFTKLQGVLECQKTEPFLFYGDLTQLWYNCFLVFYIRVFILTVLEASTVTIPVTWFEVYTAVRFIMTMICSLAPCKLVTSNQLNGEINCLHLQDWRWWKFMRYVGIYRRGLYGVKTQKNDREFQLHCWVALQSVRKEYVIMCIHKTSMCCMGVRFTQRFSW